MGLDLSQAHIALRFAWEKPKSPSRRRLETMVHGEVLHLGLRNILIPMGAEVICFAEISPNAGRPEPALELGQRILDQGSVEYPQSGVVCGIGIPVLELSEWGASFRQAGQALEMARRLSADKPLYFPDLSIYRLLYQIEHNPELMAFQEEMLGPLLAQESARERSIPWKSTSPTMGMSARPRKRFSYTAIP